MHWGHNRYNFDISVFKWSKWERCQLSQYYLFKMLQEMVMREIDWATGVNINGMLLTVCSVCRCHRWNNELPANYALQTKTLDEFQNEPHGNKMDSIAKCGTRLNRDRKRRNRGGKVICLFETLREYVPRPVRLKFSENKSMIKDIWYSPTCLAH